MKFLQRFHKIYVIIILFFSFPFTTDAQTDTVRYEVSVSALSASGKLSPFWLQSNRYGLVTHSPHELKIMGEISKEYSRLDKNWDYGYTFSLILGNDKFSTIYRPHEYFIKTRYKAFELNIGAREEIIGNQDPSLSLGGMIFSKNSRPMPKISLGIERFTTVPYTFGLLEIRGAIAHGWFTDNIYTKNMLLHHKYLYAQLGGHLPVKIQYGVEHAAQWGGKFPANSPYSQMRHNWKDFFTIFIGGSGGIGGEEINALGNHILSQSLGLNLNINNFEINTYWQNITEDGPLRIIFNNTMNSADGLWGISLKNDELKYVNKIVFEYLNTTDQSGPYHDKDGIVYGGCDDYYNNYIYLNGWNYFMRTIGTPFITSPAYNTNGSIRSNNNMVRVRHVGLEGEIGGAGYRGFISFSKNYGDYNLRKQSSDLSLLLDVKKKYPKLDNLEICWSIAADFGSFYGNNIGLLVTLKKSGDLFSY